MKLASRKRASSKASQRRWLAKPGNRGYFRSPDNVERVREWRKNHPGYWRNHRRTPPAPPPLQESAFAHISVSSAFRMQKTFDALQDLVFRQKLVLDGYIARMAGTALQEVFGEELEKSYLMGRTIYGI